jgi:hypothetical protein
MLVAAPVMVLRGFLDRMANDCDDLSAWPFIWPFMWPFVWPFMCAEPFKAPFDAVCLGFFARPLAWAAIVAAARVFVYLSR